MEASVDPQCRGPDWMPITPKTGSLFHAETHAMTLDQLGAKMRCDKCGKRPERYYPANQSDTAGFVRRI